MAENPVQDIQKTVTDGFYVAVGLGVIAFQKAQVRRNELKKQFEDGSVESIANVTEALKTVDERAQAVQAQVDNVLDDVQGRLPEPVADVMKGVRAATADARNQLRTTIGVA